MDLKEKTKKTNIWQQLPKPFFAVAPMADVTDAAFRQMIAKYSAHARADGTVRGPDVMWTEFVSADGLTLAPEEGRKKLMADLLYTEAERPVVAQLFTRHPSHMENIAKLCLELGFDGVDINMGCPAGAIIDQGCGAAMIKTPEIAREVIQAAKRGAKSDEGGIPVSVKTRLGYNTDQVEEWIPVLLAEQPAALTVHARTRKDMSKVPARWERLQRVVEFRNILSPGTKIIGNGDVLSMEDGRQKAELSGVDGVMVGRALFGNPWFFHPHRQLPLRLSALPTHGVERDTIVHTDTSGYNVGYISLAERLTVLVEHSKLFTQLLPHKNFSVMKKHFKAYVGGFPGAVELRMRLMEQETPEAVEKVINKYLAGL
ncbi:MAG: tRNA dihydrouridine synthase [Candidatus Paceibacteria bacterium]